MEMSESITKKKSFQKYAEYKIDPSTLPYAGVRKTSEYDSPSYICMRDRMFYSHERPPTRQNQFRSEIG